MYNNYKNAGDVAYVAQDYSTAAENYDKAAENDPDNYEALQMLGMSYFNMGDTDSADGVFKEFIQKFPGPGILGRRLYYQPECRSQKQHQFHHTGDG